MEYGRGKRPRRFKDLEKHYYQDLMQSVGHYLPREAISRLMFEMYDAYLDGWKDGSNGIVPRREIEAESMYLRKEAREQTVGKPQIRDSNIFKDFSKKNIKDTIKKGKIKFPEVIQVYIDDPVFMGVDPGSNSDDMVDAMKFCVDKLNNTMHSKPKKKEVPNMSSTLTTSLNKGTKDMVVKENKLGEK